MLQHVLNRSNGQPSERGAVLSREKFGDFVLVLRLVEASGNLGLGIPSAVPGVFQQHPFPALGGVFNWIFAGDFTGNPFQTRLPPMRLSHSWINSYADTLPN